jgi:hypothetical protein
MAREGRTSVPVEILLIEDNPGDVRLTREALRDAKVVNHVSVAPTESRPSRFCGGKGST